MFRVPLRRRFTLRPMFDQLLAGFRVLAKREAAVMFFLNRTPQAEFRSQSPVPLAYQLLTFGVITLVGSGVLEFVVVADLLSAERLRDLQHSLTRLTPEPHGMRCFPPSRNRALGCVLLN